MRPFGRFLIVGAACLLVVPLAVHGQGTGASAADFASLFAYQQDEPTISEIGVEDRDGIAIHDITFESPVTGQPISAYLVTPPGEGPFAGILYVHWAGTEENTNRTEFLEEAVSMAGEGVVSLLVDGMWAGDWFIERDSSQDFSASIEQVINLRRAIDVLLAQPNVDPNRLAYVGHDFGAMYGATLSGADDRIDNYVFIAGTDQYMDWFNYVSDLSNDERAEMSALFEAIDPITVFSRRLPRSTFFQFSESDQYVTPATMIGQYQAATPNRRRIATYRDNHAMATPIVRHDRIDWLRTQLRLPDVE